MWDFILNILGFTGVGDKTVWQDIFISALIIPIVIFLGNKFLIWWNSKKPPQLLFRNCFDNSKNIFIFHSQMSGADRNWNLNKNQKCITRYPDPLPSNRRNLGIQKKKNIDPVLSGAEAECLTDVYNILGRVGKLKNIHMGDLINDWNVWSVPIFSIGFNPKTRKLIEKCDPIYFELLSNVLKIKNSNIELNSFMPNDAGVVQKTFNKDTNDPVFILAGLGTTGTSAAGYIFKKYFVKLGKLFASKPFCLFLTTKIDEGKSSALVKKIYPKPNWCRIILHPFVYFEFQKKDIFNFEISDE